MSHYIIPVNNQSINRHVRFLYLCDCQNGRVRNISLSSKLKKKIYIKIFDLKLVSTYSKFHDTFSSADDFSMFK